MIRAIETSYKGYRFRSRLEARWAVFFDAFGIRWRYETQGFETAFGRYLPDFWLFHCVKSLASDGWGFWAEVKPFAASEAELAKVVAVVEQTKHNALIFQGEPWPGDYKVTKVSGTHFSPPLIFRDLEFTEESDEDFGPLGMVQLSNGSFSSYPSAFFDSEKLKQAFQEARSARFEFGETPSVTCLDETVQHPGAS